MRLSKSILSHGVLDGIGYMSILVPKSTRTTTQRTCHWVYLPLPGIGRTCRIISRDMPNRGGLLAWEYKVPSATVSADGSKQVPSSDEGYGMPSNFVSGCKNSQSLAKRTKKATFPQDICPG